MKMMVLWIADQGSPRLAELSRYHAEPDCRILRAANGPEGLAVLHAQPVDLLIIDGSPSDGSGVQLATRAMALQPGLQVILLIEPEEWVNGTRWQGESTHPMMVAMEQSTRVNDLRAAVNRCLEFKKLREALQQNAARLHSEMENRKQAEEFADRALTTRIAISALLETGLESMALSRQIEVILDIILTIPWFSGLRKGVFFLMDNQTGQLRLAGQRYLTESIVSSCAQVPLGHCLCGRAAQRQEIVFSGSLSDEHENRYEGIQPHGHYCVPVVSKGHLLGVLCLYVPDGHQWRSDEEALLTTISHTLALILEHRQIESELGKAEEQLRFMAYHDPLTGLHNRQSFDQTFNKLFLALQSPNRRHNESAFQGSFLTIFDIDHFKKVNDTYGHLIGDEVLVLFARLMTDCFRENDATFRFGGEEFVVLLNDIAPDSVGAVLNRFRRSVEEYDFPQVGRVTVSIGAVQIEPGELAGSLTEKADKALYFSKSNGRNQVNLYHQLVAAGHLEEVVRETEEVDLW